MVFIPGRKQIRLHIQNEDITVQFRITVWVKPFHVIDDCCAKLLDGLYCVFIMTHDVSRHVVKQIRKIM